MPRQSFWSAVLLLGLVPAASVATLMRTLTEGGPGTRSGACLMTYNDTLYVYSNPAMYAISLPALQNASAEAAWQNHGSHERASNLVSTDICAVTSNGYAVALGSQGNATAVTLQVFDMLQLRWKEPPALAAGAGMPPTMDLNKAASSLWQGRWWYLLDRTTQQMHVLDTHRWQWTTEEETRSAPPRIASHHATLVKANGYLHLLDTEPTSTVSQHQYVNRVYAFDPVQRRWLGVVGSFWSNSRMPLLVSTRNDHMFVIDTAATQEPLASSNATALLWTIPIQSNGTMRTMQVQPLGMPAPHEGTVQIDWRGSGMLVLYDTIGYTGRASFLTLFNPRLNEMRGRFLVGLGFHPHESPPGLDQNTTPFWDSTAGQQLKVGLSCAAGVIAGLVLVLAVFYMRQKRKVSDQKPATVRPAWVLSDDDNDDVRIEDASTWSHRVRHTLSSIMLQYHYPSHSQPTLDPPPWLPPAPPDATNDSSSRFKEHFDPSSPTSTTHAPTTPLPTTRPNDATATLQ